MSAARYKPEVIKNGSDTPTYKLVFYKNRSTPQVIRSDRLEEPRPKKGYGEITGQRDASEKEIKEIEKGKWLRVDLEGRTPSDPRYKITEYRKQLGEKRRKAMEQKNASILFNKTGSREWYTTEDTKNKKTILTKTSGVRKFVGDTLRGDDKGLDWRWGLSGGSISSIPLTIAQLSYINKVLDPAMKKSIDPASAEKLINFATQHGVKSRSSKSIYEAFNRLARRQNASGNSIKEFISSGLAQVFGHTNGAFLPSAKGGKGRIIYDAAKASPGVLAHELGHSQQSKLLLKAHTLKSLASLGTLGSLLSKDENTSRNFALGGTAAFLPTLAAEVGASVRGHNIMKGLKLKGRLMPFIGLPTYFLGASAPMLAHYTKKYFGGFDKQK